MSNINFQKGSSYSNSSLKLDLWSPWKGFIPIITTNLSNKIKKEKSVKKRFSKLKDL